jgi:hypothetical protein
MADKLPSAESEIASFLAKVEALPKLPQAAGKRGRLIFALDATQSREPTWDQAAQIQAEMFDATAALGGLDIQLVHYGGIGGFEASPFLADAVSLRARMLEVRCRPGGTQIARVLAHARRAALDEKVNALVFIGDAVEENAGELFDRAGALALLGLPVFLFHEGSGAEVRRVFERIAELTGGACCRFDPASARQLADLLGGVAAYAAGGRAALVHYAERKGGELLRLTAQLKR